MITTLRPKADVLMDFEEECWLVDDRPLGFELTNNVSFVQVCLDSTTVLDPEADWPVFYNLGDVKVFFDELMY